MFLSGRRNRFWKYRSKNSQAGQANADISRIGFLGPSCVRLPRLSYLNFMSLTVPAVTLFE
jgi:hypothetical protein